MRALTRAARAICYATAGALDRAQREKSEAARRAAYERASLLTPVAKAFSTDIGIEVASLGVQVHGGMGFIDETGAAQHLRDARIATIYEGTNGIQAIDLVTRKLPLAGGAAVKACLDEMRETVVAVTAVNDPAFGATAPRLAEAVESLDRASAWLLKQLDASPDAALAGATPYLRLFGTTAGGALLANEALAAIRTSDAGAEPAARIGLARFFAENLAVQAPALERTVVEGAESLLDTETLLASA
jgi:3-(methylsulfanyl)propanoyl-CoA dehydrogenase